MIPRLFLVTDRALAADLPRAVDVALAGLGGVACAVLLREKDLSGRALLGLARRLREITRAHGARLVVSGRFDVALAAEADGVHCGGEAPSPADLRRISPVGFLVGASIHAEERPPEGADYALLSPVFPTRSKPGATPLGLAGLRAGVSRSPVPVIALGGVDATNAGDCLAAGAHGVAMRGGWLHCGPDVAARLRGLC